MIGYRSDIDGLRAVAVLSVVAYHAVPWAVPGGFVGVDVFFVISGFLITRLIAADIDRRRFSVASFYVRRTKRIFPVLFVVLFTTLALGWWLLPPSEFAQMGKSMAATAGFVSNIAFWQDTGYFDSAAELKPLLHTWSLAVEEQFYVLWPLTLLLLYRRRLARVAVLAAIALSFAASCYLTVRHQPTAFFLLPPRTWELLLGAALALGYLPALRGAGTRDAAAVAGLVLILASTVLLDASTPFPGWNALYPCLGAALVIAAGDGGDNAAGRWFLGRSPVVFVGLISYSLYLWHWPLLAFARVVFRGALPTSVALAAVAVAALASVLTWRFVERPLRVSGATPAAAPVLLRYAALSIAALVAGLVVQGSGGFRAQASAAVAKTERARYDVNPLSGACLRWQAVTGPLPGEPCLTPAAAGAPRLVIWGDSHADAAAPGFAVRGAATGHATYQLTMAGCPPLIGVELRGAGADYAPCAAFNRQVIEYVTSDPAVDVVALVARWTLYTENQRFGDDPGPITYLVDDADGELSTAASKRVFARALAATVDAIRGSGRRVILLGTIPPIGVNVPDCLARNEMPLSGVVPCDADAARVRSHVAFADAVIERAAAEPGVCSYLPVEALCRTDRCVSVAGDDILYANDDHLSARGATFLAGAFDFDRCLGSPRRDAMAGQAAAGTVRP